MLVWAVRRETTGRNAQNLKLDEMGFMGQIGWTNYQIGWISLEISL